MAEITPTTAEYRPPSDVLHDSEQRVVLDIPARVVFKVMLVGALAWLAINALTQLTGLIIQLAIAPVFLLTGVGTKLAVLINRLARIIDRSRVLEDRLSVGGGGSFADAQAEPFGLPPLGSEISPLFAAGRTAGWVAHRRSRSSCIQPRSRSIATSRSSAPRICIAC